MEGHARAEDDAHAPFVVGIIMASSLLGPALPASFLQSSAHLSTAGAPTTTTATALARHRQRSAAFQAVHASDRR